MKLKNILIVTPSKDAISETFIQSHWEHLMGNIFILYGYFPELYYNNRVIRLFYRKHKYINKLKKLFPFFIYEKYILPKENTEEVVNEYISTFLLKNKIDIVLAEYGHSGALIFPYLKKLNIPLIVHFHGMDANHKWYLDRYMVQYKQMFEYAKHIISVSEKMHQQLISYGADEQKLVLNPYGPRNYFFEIQPLYLDCFISIGRFADTKAPFLTIMAFKLVLNNYSRAKLIFIGDGTLREACINLARSLGILDKIEFKGAIKHDEILKIIPEACCYIQHSITTTQGEMEGTPNSILEAQAAALPVVSTRHAGINEAVIHGETGFLVDEFDYKAMANYMSQLIKDKDLCREMGENARIHVQKHYSIEKYIETLQELINK